ncbi:putative lipoprotein [Prevotella sp. CAG:474]|jgi:hypothetical protein|uniref:DUF6242 domain-containing protein n=1 Tax=Prevotella sp. P4-51 TaxID=2024228 RepID=UPI000335CC0A|nr:DUF6242 domain-containing protein [Prevotella sp. P4-51]CDC98558.1 putative lipoprotein [Prevotella sp. CAG:474]
MKRKFIPFILLVSTIFFVSSCLGDDNEEIVFSDQVGITAFSLGTQKIIRDTVSKKGADSTYQTTLDCSKYIFYIDQTKHEIYNPDSLPVGIDCKKIICNVTSKGSSVTLVKNIDSDTLQAFETIDSMDFSKPRTLRMVSMSGRASCDYTVKVNIHKQKPNVFEWKIATGCTDMGLLTGMRALAMGGKVYVVGRDDSQLRIYAAEEQHVVSWTEITPNVELGADSYKDMTVMGGKLYAHAEDGVYCSTDAYTWTRVGTPAISRLLGGSNKRLYALSTDNKIVASADGATWTAEKMDTPADSLPTGNVSMTARPILTNPGTDRVVMVGTGDKTSKVWSKVEETDEGSEQQAWTYMDVAGDNRFRLPNLANLQMTYYDDFMMALGGSGIGNSQGTTAYGGSYTSSDGGMTWRIRKLYALPTNFNIESNRFAFTADSQNYLWLIDGKGNLWRGRLNRLGWAKDKTYFGE